MNFKVVRYKFFGKVFFKDYLVPNSKRKFVFCVFFKSDQSL